MATTVPKTINFITTNKHKLAEVQQILAPGLEKQGIELTSQAVEVVEVQGSLEEVTRAKVGSAAEKVNGPVLVEDTALVFNAFGGELPGPYIKHFITALGVTQLHLLLSGFKDKTATAICTFAYTADPGKEILLFQGRTEGRIVPARGPTDFGWDAAFEFEGRTYAEMSKGDKNRVSHRGRALGKLRAWLEGVES
ncbi:MAG: hypothetical protein Q9159_001954 [Coniocarpon cinnabarinum]